MSESFKPLSPENQESQEKLLGEIYSLNDQVDLLKDLLSISGSLTVSIFKDIFKLY